MTDSKDAETKGNDERPGMEFATMLHEWRYGQKSRVIVWDG